MAVSKLPAAGDGEEPAGSRGDPAVKGLFRRFQEWPARPSSSAILRRRQGAAEDPGPTRAADAHVEAGRILQSRRGLGIDIVALRTPPRRWRCAPRREPPARASIGPSVHLIERYLARAAAN